jgi:tRNA(Ile2) C34 agmatinyltransferase TiaS
MIKGKIESDSRPLCPECKSAEGFWQISKPESTFFQCKHCGVILDASRIVTKPKKPEPFKIVVKLHR